MGWKTVGVTLPNPFCQRSPEILLFDFGGIPSECLSFNLDLITHLEILLCNYFLLCNYSKPFLL